MRRAGRRDASRYESYLCYYQAGGRAGASDEAARRLDRLRADGRGGGWPLLVRAHVAAARREGPARTGELYREAAERLAAEGRAVGEVIARTNLRRIRHRQGDRAGAEAEVEAALRAARRAATARRSCGRRCWRRAISSPSEKTSGARIAR